MVYAFSSIRDHSIPKSLKCSNSATKMGYHLKPSGALGSRLDLEVEGFRV